MDGALTWKATDNRLYLSPPKDFNFHHCLRFLNRNSLECLHTVKGNRWLKLVKISGEKVLIQVLMSSNNLCIETINKKIEHQGWIEVVKYLQEVLDLDRDLTPFYSQLDLDPVLGGLAGKYRGLRLIGIPDLFEALCWCVIGQQINLSFAYTLKRRLVMEAGEKINWGGNDYYLFPTPQAVAQLRPQDFSQWQYSSSKARYLIGIAQVMNQDLLLKQELMNKSPAEAQSMLESLKGVGPWSAQYVMMKCLRMVTAYPIEDVGLHNALKLLLKRQEKPSRKELEAWGQAWHPWQAYATFYLWHSLIAEP